MSRTPNPSSFIPNSSHIPELRAKPFGFVLLMVLAVSTFASCHRSEVTLIEKVKKIPVSGANDVVYVERSTFWDGAESNARSESNRQIFTFQPPPKTVLFVTLENMGGVPMKRDTFKTRGYRFAEVYLRTSTRDTNLQIHIETNDKTKPPTNVAIYMRNIDTVRSQILFEGMK